MKTILTGVCLVVLCAASCACSQELTEVRSLTGEEAAALEKRAMEILPLRRWDGEHIRELARNVQSLPDHLAAEILWRTAAAPASLDTNIIFSNALTSSSPVVRGLAASLLASGISAESTRFLLNTLAIEQDEEIITAIVRGMAHLPQKRAVRSLMDIMFLPGATGVVIEEAASELRRLTGANHGASPLDWRDWWLEHEADY